MKNFTRSISILAIILSIAFSAGTAVAAPSQTMLSKQEVKILLATARTAADHRVLASYYRQQADEYTRKSVEHSAMAARFATGSAISQSKPGIQGEIHCRYFASEYGEQARKAAALAVSHEEMAATAQSSAF